MPRARPSAYSVPDHPAFFSSAARHPFAWHAETREDTVRRILSGLDLKVNRPHTYLELKTRLEQEMREIPSYAPQFAAALDYLETRAFREERAHEDRETIEMSFLGTEPVRFEAGEPVYMSWRKKSVNTGSVTTAWIGGPEPYPRARADAMIDGFMREQYLRAGYRNAEVTRMLEIEKDLPLQRTLYFSQLHASKEVLLSRIFDGSDDFSQALPFERQKIEPVRLHDGKPGGHKLPLEIQYKVALPEKLKAEIGRLAVDPKVPGFKLALFFFAVALSDAHPGPGGAGIHPDLKISVSARPAAARLFRRLGFVDREDIAQPKKAAILTMTGADFWREFAEGKAPSDFWPSIRRSITGIALPGTAGDG
jgi:hypothetical protein